MHWKRFIPILFAVAATAIMATSAFGQCAMCRASLTGSNNALFIRNFNIGVLVLLVPPVTIFCSIFIALRRYKNGAADEHTEDNDNAQ
jgi:hypothetical protein